jgi:hypothetical protein
MRELTRAFALAIGMLLLSMTRSAGADLGDDVEKLAADFGRVAKLRRLPARLLEKGTVHPLLLDREETDPTSESCTSVAVLGAPSVNLLLRFLPGAGPQFWPDGESPEASSAGAVQLVRCGARKSMLQRLALEMRSPRGVVEIVVARAAQPLPPLYVSLPHRDPGPSAPPGASGPRPISAPLSDRADALGKRVRRQGAVDATTQIVAAARDGSGELDLRLGEGCYRMDLLGVPSPAGHPRGVDLDAELVFVPEGTLAARDRTDSADASLALCIGRPRVARLRFAGTIPGSPVVMLMARWELPKGLPAAWGPLARARIAESVRRHHHRDLPGTPIYASLGVTGVTILPVELEPGACYLAALAAIRGEPAGIALAAEVGRRRSEDNPGPGANGTSIAFCAGAEERGRLEVEARGAGLSWLLAVWQTGRLPIGEPAE